MAKKQQKSKDGSACGCGGEGFSGIAEAMDCIESPYKAMVLSCIDPRMQRPVFKYLNKEKRNLRGRYSQMTLAGAAIGAVAPAFEGWHQTFWDHLDTTLKLHKISEVFVIQHRDCGAARAAYGYFNECDPESEARIHRAVVAELQRQLHARRPQLKFGAILMDLDGSREDLL